MTKIICGNNADIMAGFPGGFIDLTVTSPPYDNLRAYNGYEWDFESLAQQLYRCTKDGGVVVWVVGDATINGSETGTSFRQALGFKDAGFKLCDTMIYTAAGTGAKGSNRLYWQGFEYMFIFSKGRHKTFNPIEDVKNQFAGKKSSGRFGSSEKPHVTKEISKRTNIWRYSVGQTRNKHPAVFPERLARDHIVSWSNPNDLVFDPFLGSGTTAHQAIETGRRCLGIDISEEYCQLAKRRIATAKTPLFPDAM